jgi:hypothetical protein
VPAVLVLCSLTGSRWVLVPVHSDGAWECYDWAGLRIPKFLLPLTWAVLLLALAGQVSAYLCDHHCGLYRAAGCSQQTRPKLDKFSPGQCEADLAGGLGLPVGMHAGHRRGVRREFCVLLQPRHCLAARSASPRPAPPRVQVSTLTRT